MLLWDAGLDEVEDPTDTVPTRKLATAKRALGLASARQLRSIAHLAEAAGVSSSEARERLRDAGLITARTGDRLPRGTLKKSRKILGLQHAGGFARLVRADYQEPSPRVPPRTEQPAFTWHKVGTEEKIEFLTPEEIERIHHALAEDFARSGDPITPAGCRDRNLLESAATRPQTGMGQDAKYPTVPLAAAALFHSLALNHAFSNGNKRTALVSLLVFLDRNKYVLDVTEKEIFRRVLLVAQHGLVRDIIRPHPDHEVLVLAEWIYSKMRRVRKDEYPMRWGELRKVLRGHGCDLQVVSGKMKISRPIPRAWFRGGTRILKSQPHYRDDGSDAAPTTIHRIRRDLHLDEEHGVDSDVFYRGSPVIDVFIARYRKTLMRLARL